MTTVTIDGNTAAATVSYAFSQLAVIYPITPSSPMAELAEKWQASGKANMFGETVRVVQMQSESGVAGALHGALACGTLATSYTCSQGLLLMQPNLFKIAGELLPTVIHVSARALSTHALSIFGDHQDVMACRQTGFAMLCSASVQEAHDMALIAHLATLQSSIPFLHFFDGFRTSHEYQKIEVLSTEEMRKLLNEDDINAFRVRRLTPNQPIQRGTAQNPDVYFQNREACNPYYDNLPSIVQKTMDNIEKLTKRAYHVFDYYGAEDAERVIVLMGSACDTAKETVDILRERGEKVGVIQVRLYRPFFAQAFLDCIPKTCQRIAVLDRTKEPGAIGEPLYTDVCGALAQGRRMDIRVVGGRYGLGMKEFTPSDCNAVFVHLERETPWHNFTVGLVDDVSERSLLIPPFSVSENALSCKFYGLGSDGSVGTNKQTVKLLGEKTKLFVQGYFEYDSKKSGGVTISHLRLSDTPIRAPYLIGSADFIACHTPSYLTRFPILDELKEGGRVLLNCPCTQLNELDAYLPHAFKQTLAKKHAKLFVIDATKIAKEAGLHGRTSTIMQASFFALHEHILEYESAKAWLIADFEKRFSSKSPDVVQKNILAVERAQSSLHEIVYPREWENETLPQPIENNAGNAYFQSFIRPILELRGNDLPVSAFQADGSVPTGTAKWEKRGAPHLLPTWLAENCIQCNQCAFVCPHACIRPFIFADNPFATMPTLPAVGIKNACFRIQVSPYDCMGCGVCADTCPTKNKALIMQPADPQTEQQSKFWNACTQTKQADTSAFARDSVKGSQFYPPLFEFSYACAGCGETPYIKLLTQLFGERLVIANATGCSSIYGGSAPCCPYTKNENGCGPAWANSLFEDNAEFGFGMQLAQAFHGNEASVWCIGGDGWAYDIGFNGIDHVLSQKERVRLLVLDSQVYSNTGGQCSKATPRGTNARFATGGKRIARKDLGLIASCYPNAYVAQVSMGANKPQLIRAFMEAEAHDGPSIVIAYSPCIAHGVSLQACMAQEKLAVESGFWHLFRINPDLRSQGKNPISIDSPIPGVDLSVFLSKESRFVTATEEDVLALKKESEQKLAFLKHLQSFYEK